MTEPTTIRERIERIRLRTGEHWQSCECIQCLNYRDAVAALALLDNTQGIFYLGDHYRVIFLEVVPDPAPRVDAP